MSQIIRLGISDLKPDMVLAENLVTPLGMMVLAKGTRFNTAQFEKLKAYKINKAAIFEETINPDAPTFIELQREQEESEREAFSKLANLIINESELAVEKNKEFRKFAKQYDEGIDNVKEKFFKISQGGSIQVNELYETASNIISNAFTRSDVFTYLRSLKIVDDYTYSHCINVSILCNMFGKWLGFNNETIKDLTIAGMLHDIGKIDIDPKILNKNAKLTPEEFELVKKHPTFGYEKVMNNSNVNSRMKTAILMHHERMDGSGYPLKISGDTIDDFAKIIGICDVFDAMISDRPYRIKYCPFDVIQKFERDYYGLFDTKFLFIFLDNVVYNYVGAKVRLSNAQTGEVIFINGANKSRPIVKVDHKFIDLSKTNEIKIVKVL